MGGSGRGRRIRLGIAGLGMGLSHARACLSARGVELAAMADAERDILERKREKIVQSCGQKGLARLAAVPLYADYRRMVKEAELDAVLIALPTAMHADSSLFALEAGLHVLCEKPPAVGAEEMARVAERARATGLTYMYARQQRFMPAKQLVRRLAAQGQLGEIYHAETKWIRSGNIPFRHGWGVNRDHGGGVLLDLGVHAIDDGWFLMGCPRPVEVLAAMHCSFAPLGDAQKLQMPYNADDGCMGTILFENGASMSFAVTFAMNTAAPPHRREKGTPRVEWTELSVYGDKAGAEIHEGLLIRRKGRTEDTQVRPIKAEMPKGKTTLILQLEHFCDCLRKGKEVQNTADQAVMLMQMLDAVRESAQKRRSVSIGQPASV